jgi:hypothetical protein
VLLCCLILQPKPIKLTKHSEVPDDVLNKRGPTRRQTERLDAVVDRIHVPQRQKGESSEEKRSRKQAVKEMRRVCFIISVLSTFSLLVSYFYRSRKLKNE